FLGRGDLLPGPGQHLHGHPGAARAPLRLDLAATGWNLRAQPRAAAGRASMSDPSVGHLLDAGLLGEPVAASREGTSDYVLEAVDLHKRYGHNEVLRGVTFGVHRGDVKAVLGPSGSGKSTMLRCLALLEPVHAGHDRLDGRRIGVRESRGRLV